jgi:hypothetical protein
VVIFVFERRSRKQDGAFEIEREVIVEAPLRAEIELRPVVSPARARLPIGMRLALFPEVGVVR